MKFAFLFYEDHATFDSRGTAEVAAYNAAWGAYIGSLRAAGILTGGDALDVPTTATTVRVDNGKRHVQDGPFADTKEQLGGFVTVELPSLDDALAWAARCPCASDGAVEVRPTWEMRPQ